MRILYNKYIRVPQLFILIFFLPKIWIIGMTFQVELGCRAISHLAYRKFASNAAAYQT